MLEGLVLEGLLSLSSLASQNHIVSATSPCPGLRKRQHHKAEDDSPDGIQVRL